MGVISKILRIKNKQRRDIKNSELQFFSFESIVSATNSFSDKCKLGEGGFGPVYKARIIYFFSMKHKESLYMSTKNDG